MHEHNSNTIASVPLTQIIDLWEQYRRPAQPSVRTVRDVTRRFTEFTGCYCLADIKRQNFIEWRDYLLETRAAKPVTWNNYLKHMRVLLRFAASAFEWRGVAVLNGVKTLPIDSTTKKTMDQDVIHRIIDWLEYEQSHNVNPGWFWSTTIKVFYFTGIRRRQLVGLTWGDIDTRKMTVRLVAEHSKTKRGWLIPLHPALVPVLADLRKRVEGKLKRPVRADEQLLNCNLFYTRGADGNMHEEQVSSAFKRIREHTGLKISAHRFRHTFATKLANQNGGEVNLKNVQTILGHTNISTTLGYVEPDMGVMRDLVGGLSNDF